MSATAQQAVRMTHEEIILALEHDAEFFIQFFLGDELTVPVPEFHKDCFSLMTHEQADRCVFAIPRGHAKTTLAKLACVWYFLFSPFRFIVYVSATSDDLAIPSVNDIIEFMLSENFRAVFGDLEFSIRRAGDGLYKFVIPSIGKTCILRALGVQKTVRGINVDNERPELAILDDIENRENINDERLYKKLRTWVYATFLKALNQFNNKVIHLGNMVYTRSLLAKHVRSERWFSRLYGCVLANGKPLWPDLWPIAKLAADFIEYQQIGEADSWFAEMMNHPIPPGGGVIKADEILYLAPRLANELEYAFITVDLAISDNTWAHQTVIAVHGWVTEAEIWQIVEYKYWQGIDPIGLFDEIVALCYKWQLSITGIEDVAYQAALKHVYRYLALERNLIHLRFVPLFANRKKAERIITWAAECKAKRYALTEGDFMATQQLITYDPTKKDNDDDIIDCCSYGPQMKTNYMTEIISQQLPAIGGVVQSVATISPV